MDLTSTLVYSAIALTPLLLAWVYRKRLLRAFWRALTQMLVSDYFELDVREAADGTKVSVLRPNARAGAFLTSLSTGLMEWARKNIKITLPSIPGLAGAPSIGQAAGLMLSGPIKDFVPKDIKPYAGQIGMAIGERIGPWLEGLLGGIQGLGSKTKPTGKAGLSPEAQKLVDEAMK